MDFHSHERRSDARPWISHVLGAFANDKAWTIMRRVVIRLTAPVRLEDESDIRNELSRSKAISSLVWTTKRKRALRRALRDPGRDSATKISPWFGVAAVVNATGFVVLGIFLPWLLSEGLQGEPIVTAGNATTAVPIHVAEVATEPYVRNTVEADYRSCDLSAAYREEEECHVIRQYHFITANVANRSSILHFSRNVTLEHLGINENSNMRIRHQLACAPADLDRLVAQEGKKHRIHLLLTHAIHNTQSYMTQNVTWDMPLLTSNKLGSGRTVLGSNDPIVRMWDLSMADVLLPSVPEFQTSLYPDQFSAILDGLERRFLIIHKASSRVTRLLLMIHSSPHTINLSYWSIAQLDYTNINFIGFWVVLLSYIVIIFWSYAMFVDHQRILSTLRAAASNIWQKVNRIIEGSKLLLESATSAMRKGHRHARSRTFSAFRSGHRTVHPRNDSQYSGPQHELPTRTTSGSVDPGDEPDNPLKSARL
ncbi:uncharacterized protein PAC_17173 [Phialocephala subalpina]|uniref:Uncharacterized protein n=1 Tax=Phialocephala subalpina TaxID=576137 RepID=A0A1L7XQF3_9HELO|nr:uncharacterized protein PAC_17173 [Phialocephala subalpina]